MRMRTGYRLARCTQLRVRCTSGRPGVTRPRIEGSGITPYPVLSTTPAISQSGVRHEVYLRSHARLNVLQLRLTEIRKHPPHASIDKRENLLSDVSICTLRNHEIGYSCVERSVDAALVVVVLGISDGGGPSLPLGNERIERKYA